MADNIEKLYAMADKCLAKELGEGRWVTDEDGDRTYTEEAQDEFNHLISGIYDLVPCYWEGPYIELVVSSEEELFNAYNNRPQGTEVWVLRGHREGHDESVRLFTSKELAEEGLKLLFGDEYGVYENLEPEMSFEDFLGEFCS